jgi:hypothetical protein
MPLFKLTIKGDVVEVTQQAREAQLYSWLTELTAFDPEAHSRCLTYIHEYLDTHTSATGRDIAVTGPGDTWRDEFVPLYDRLNHGRDPRETHANAGKFLGLILWEAMLERADEWHFTRYPKNLDGEDFFVTHYYSIPGHIHVKIAERQHQNLLDHNRVSPGVGELARRLTEKWRSQ